MKKYFKELRSKEEANEFQKKNYGKYCEKYKIFKKKMKKAEYKYRIFRHEESLDFYLGTLFSEINKYLRGNKKTIEENGSQDFYYDVLIDRMSEIIYCAPTLQENIVVYRVIEMDALKTIMKDVNKNGRYKENGFMSTSLLKETSLKRASLGFGGYTNSVIMKIYVPKGVHVLGVDSILNRGEDEMLFPTGRELQYKGRCWEKITKPYIYEFELIPDASELFS